MPNTLVTSYSYPDLDGTSCAVAYAELLRLQGQNAEAAFFGELHDESRYLLDTYKISYPTMNQDNTKVILFDFDGVIVNTFSICYNIWGVIHNLSVEEYRAKFEGNIFETLHEKTDEKDLSEDIISSYASQLLSSDPEGGVLDVIKKLAEDYILIMVSSMSKAPILEYLKTKNLDEYFTEIFGGDFDRSKVKKMKYVLDKYSVGPDQAIFITDTLGDILEAEKCDVKSIAVTWGYHPREVLEAGNPQAIVNKPSEIIDNI